MRDQSRGNEARITTSDVRACLQATLRHAMKRYEWERDHLNPVGEKLFQQALDALTIDSAYGITYKLDDVIAGVR